MSLASCLHKNRCGKRNKRRNMDEITGSLILVCVEFVELWFSNPGLDLDLILVGGCLDPDFEDQSVDCRSLGLYYLSRGRDIGKYEW